jgi:threonine/homoserine/homoserine lactone efflux protein
LGIPFLIKGLLIGLSSAAPLGPIGILCINRTLTEGPRMGFICGLGAAAADALYALAGSVALSVIGQWIIDDRTALRVVGGIFLIYLGARTFMRPAVIGQPPARTPALLPPGAHAAFMSTFLLTLANPVTLLSFAAVFAGLGVAPVGTAPGVLQGAASAAAALVLGMFLGSALWWLVLSSVIGRLRHYLGVRTLAVINRVCGTVLTAFGLYAMASLLPLL